MSHYLIKVGDRFVLLSLGPLCGYPTILCKDIDWQFELLIHYFQPLYESQNLRVATSQD